MVVVMMMMMVMMMTITLMTTMMMTITTIMLMTTAAMVIVVLGTQFGDEYAYPTREQHVLLRKLIQVSLYLCSFVFAVIFAVVPISEFQFFNQHVLGILAS